MFHASFYAPELENLLGLTFMGNSLISDFLQIKFCVYEGIDENISFWHDCHANYNPGHPADDPYAKQSVQETALTQKQETI
ncbi:MAG: hypothetical protein JRD49_11400 [Deltaproteobacteria bacterium]|nr:hypothetical protein [Deltaproteobacteria bacterium]MBW2678159.1 hypothetical protein [Deltaproteobacteria bacterium]